MVEVGNAGRPRETRVETSRYTKIARTPRGEVTQIAVVYGVCAPNACIRTSSVIVPGGLSCSTAVCGGWHGPCPAMTPLRALDDVECDGNCDESTCCGGKIACDENPTKVGYVTRSKYALGLNTLLP